MGLAEPRKRLKLSHDPNNTKWTSDTNRFGHKLMIAQGWQPGQYLGAKDAPHAEFHTEANASHIKVLLKDDNLGIGAKRGSGMDTGECKQLDIFQNLLGRLNGRDEDEMAEEMRKKEALRAAIYTESKWGSQRFVRGGFLIGDKIQDLIDAEADRVRKLQGGSSDNTSDDSSSDSSEEEATPEPAVEKEKKEKKDKAKKESKKEKVGDAEKEDKKSKRKRKADDSELEEDIPERKSKKSKGEETKEERKARKAAKKAKKAEKKLRKKEEKKNKKKAKKAASEDSSSEEEDAVPAANRPILQSGRLAVRSRWIAQKRLAAADSVALGQVCLIDDSLFSASINIPTDFHDQKPVDLETCQRMSSGLE
jgi:Pin2-interacting protein X1